jgi:hypothetical protein
MYSRQYQGSSSRFLLSVGHTSRQQPRSVCQVCRGSSAVEPGCPLGHKLTATPQHRKSTPDIGAANSIKHEVEAMWFRFANHLNNVVRVVIVYYLVEERRHNIEKRHRIFREWRVSRLRTHHMRGWDTGCRRRPSPMCGERWIVAPKDDQGRRDDRPGAARAPDA